MSSATPHRANPYHPRLRPHVVHIRAIMRLLHQKFDRDPTKPWAPCFVRYVTVGTCLLFNVYLLEE